MKKELLHHIGGLLGTQVHYAGPISGGDISRACVLEAKEDRFFCKLNTSPDALAMFRAEKQGLEAIARTGTISTPEVVLCEEWRGESLLLLAFIPSKRPSARDMENFGFQLAALHQTRSSSFGWHQDTFIGTLCQSNNRHALWPAFYVQERLLPQLQLAQDQNLIESREFPGEALMESVVHDHCGEPPASLLHGDLWSGNFLIAERGEPYLIDPAVYFGHNEADLAMTRLFGGFTSHFYDAYEQVIQPSPGHMERQDLYQLYYLLVHLNLFGKSYYPPVRQLLKKYFPS